VCRAWLSKWISVGDEKWSCCLCEQVDRLVSAQVAGPPAVFCHCSPWSDADAADRLQGPLLLLHTHPFNGRLSMTTRVSRYQKGKTSLDFAEARDSEWQWHQLGCVQVCT